MNDGQSRTVKVHELSETKWTPQWVERAAVRSRAYYACGFKATGSVGGDVRRTESTYNMFCTGAVEVILEVIRTKWCGGSVNTRCGG